MRISDWSSDVCSSWAPRPRGKPRLAEPQWSNRIMARTVVSSHSKELVIGFDQPFCIIGERINPTGRKLLAAEMAAGDFSRVEADCLAQRSEVRRVGQECVRTCRSRWSPY